MFPCPWCAEPFETKAALNGHWLSTPACNRNRKTNNPLQSKYGMATGIENIPGEAMINKVRSADCDHPENLREPIYPDLTGTSQQTGYRCGYCYTEVYFQEVN